MLKDLKVIEENLCVFFRSHSCCCPSPRHIAPKQETKHFPSTLFMPETSLQTTVEQEIKKLYTKGEELNHVNI
jgi:hypothetical protein